MTRIDGHGVNARRQLVRKHRRGAFLAGSTRQLRLEALEDRRLLAAGDLLYTLFSPSPTPQSGVRQGSSVAASDDYRVAGLPFTSIGGFQATGAVKVYDAASNDLLVTLTNPAPASYDYFGYSVAVSGNYLVVGAYQDDAGTTDAGSAYVYDLTSANPTSPIAALSNPTPAYLDFFGGAVAVSGNYVVVAAHRDDTGASDAGSVYVYDLSSPTPSTPVTTLNNPSPAASDLFGNSVGLAGNYLVVGVLGDDGGATDQGSVYVYDLSSPTRNTPIATLNNPSPSNLDNFGISARVAGNYVVVGAYRDDTGATDAGSAYVYDLSSPTPSTPIATLNNPSPGTSDFFGTSVGVAGNYVVVGAYQDDTGASNAGSAYVYDLTSPAPSTPVATLNNPTPANDDNFGISVAVAGNQVIVGAYGDDTVTVDAGSAYVYDLSSVSPSIPAATLNESYPSGRDGFGGSLAANGNYLVVGTSSARGSVYVYDLFSAALIAALENPTPVSGDYFGESVAVAGNYAVVGTRGANYSGTVYLYDLTSGTPATPIATLNNPLPTPYDGFGQTLAAAGTYVVVGAYDEDTGASGAGSVYIYDLASATPAIPIATLHNPSPAVNDGFGSSVAVSGNYVIVGTSQDDTGALNAGSAYVYDLASPTPTTPILTLNNPSPGYDEQFGISVAGAGSYVVVGAYGEDTGATDTGAAYVYDLSSAAPATPIATLNNPSPAAYDYFGFRVAISGNTVVVGVYPDDTGATDAGAAYVYKLSSATITTPTATLYNPSPALQDYFGLDVAVSRNLVVVGARSDDTQNLDQGAAYVFSFPGASISGTTTGGVTEDAVPNTATGTLTIADADAGQSSFTAQAGTAGTYGSFALTTAGGWTYTLDNSKAAVQALTAGQTVTDKFSVVSSDGTANRTVTITITGVNDVPVLDGTVTGAVTEDAVPNTATGTLTIADADAGQSNFTAQAGTAGTYGSFGLTTAGVWTYTSG